MLGTKDGSWLEELLKTEFSGVCSNHQQFKAHALNMFCIECKQIGCQHCFSSNVHYLHNILQIRRYVYQSVINLQDMQKYFNCAKIQTYKTNKQKVVLLNPNPREAKSMQGKSHRIGICEVCRRAMQETDQFCSIACKLQVLVQIRDPATLTDSEAHELETNSDSEPEELPDSEEKKKAFSEEYEILDYYLPNSLRPRHRMLKRKGVPHRAHFF